MKSEPLSPMSSHSSEFSLDSAQSYGSYMSSIDKLSCSSNDLMPLVDPISSGEPLTTVTVVKQEPLANSMQGTIMSMHKPLTPPLTPTAGSNIPYTGQTSTLPLNSSNNIVKLLIPTQTEVLRVWYCYDTLCTRTHAHTHTYSNLKS